MKKNKSPEITRLLHLLSVLNEKPADMAEKTGISDRTITNFLWNDTPIGGHLLRQLHQVYGVSIDWLLSGHGEMFIDKPKGKTHPLIPRFEYTDPSKLTDAWLMTAKAVEFSLFEAGAVPGIDYTLVDLYQLAAPFVLELHKKNELAVEFPETF